MASSARISSDEGTSTHLSVAAAGLEDPTVDHRRVTGMAAGMGTTGDGLPTARPAAGPGSRKAWAPCQLPDTTRQAAARSSGSALGLLSPLAHRMVLGMLLSFKNPVGVGRTRASKRRMSPDLMAAPRVPCVYACVRMRSRWGVGNGNFGLRWRICVESPSSLPVGYSRVWFDKVRVRSRRHLTTPYNHRQHRPQDPVVGASSEGPFLNERSPV